MESLSSENSNLDNRVQELESRVQELEDRVDTVNGEKDQLELEKEALVSEKQQLDLVIAEKNEQLDHLEMTNTNLLSDVEEARSQLTTQQKKLEEIKNSVISGGEEQSKVDEEVDKVYDDQGEVKEDIG